MLGITNKSLNRLILKKSKINLENGLPWSLESVDKENPQHFPKSLSCIKLTMHKMSMHVALSIDNHTNPSQEFVKLQRQVS